MYSVHVCCTAVSSNHSVPRMSAEKWAGSESRADARGVGRSKASRAGERAVHWAMASSGARLHSLQMAEGGEGEGEEGRKRQMSDSSPPQLNRTLILEMFFLEMLGKPRVTSQ